MRTKWTHIILGIGIFGLVAFPAFPQRSGSQRPSRSRSGRSVRESRAVPRSMPSSKAVPHSRRYQDHNARSSVSRQRPEHRKTQIKLPEKTNKSMTVRRRDYHVSPKYAVPREAIEHNIRINQPRDRDGRSRQYDYARRHKRVFRDGRSPGWGVHFKDDDFSISLRSGYNWDYSWDNTYYVYETDPWIYWNASYSSDNFGISLSSGYPTQYEPYQVWVSGYWKTVYDRVSHRGSFGRVYWRTVSRKVWAPGYWKTCYR